MFSPKSRQRRQLPSEYLKRKLLFICAYRSVEQSSVVSGFEHPYIFSTLLSVATVTGGTHIPANLRSSVVGEYPHRGTNTVKTWLGS